MHFPFSTFFSISRLIPGPTVFFCFIFQVFFSFLTLFQVLQCAFLMFNVIQYFSPYFTSYSVCFSLSMIFSYLTIFQVLQFTFLIFHIFQCFSSYFKSYSVYFSFSSFFHVPRHISCPTVCVSHFPRFLVSRHTPGPTLCISHFHVFQYFSPNFTCYNVFLIFYFFQYF